MHRSVVWVHWFDHIIIGFLDIPQLCCRIGTGRQIHGTKVAGVSDPFWDDVGDVFCGFVVPIATGVRCFVDTGGSGAVFGAAC
jgi:hypothetical protein